MSKTCSNCNTTLKENQKFCTQCGTKYEENNKNIQIYEGMTTIELWFYALIVWVVLLIVSNYV